MFRLIARTAAMAVIAFAAHSATAAAQVAPTLPSDTLQGRKLPPEANVPRQVIAPTLPSDTLKAAERLCTEPMGPRPVASTPRPPAAPADTIAVAADTTSIPCRVPPVSPDSAAPAQKEDAHD
ncbi:MAG TPA: hypothetical protein VFT04_14435 [Gemmatimonadales bacterium]|nr:hypothetical protein [Gemmatimonadales bacterium]